MLALLPLDPRRGRLLGPEDGRAREPGLDRCPQRGLAAETERELELLELDAEARAQLGERIQLVELADAVAAIAGRTAARHDESLLLEIAQHARRPPRAAARLADGHERLHAANLTTLL